jgi:hypothetical protein
MKFIQIYLSIFGNYFHATVVYTKSQIDSLGICEHGVSDRTLATLCRETRGAGHREDRT